MGGFMNNTQRGKNDSRARVNNIVFTAYVNW